MTTSAKQISAYLLANVDSLTTVDHVVTAGQKIVFKARYHDNVIALKVVRVGDLRPTVSEYDEDPEDDERANAESERLKRELDILKRCSSANIVKLSAPMYFEFSLQSDKFGAYGEEWIDGKDLAAIFAHRRYIKSETIALGLALCSAVEELDKHGFIHRDIKPANIMQRPDGTFVLVDPGMALDRAGPSMTGAGVVPGTIRYISPEQWDPSHKRDLDIRSDMFPIGIVMFEALTGSHPYVNGGMSLLDVMTAARSKSRLDLVNPQLRADDPLRTVISRLLSSAPYLRYKNASALRGALEDAK